MASLNPLHWLGDREAAECEREMQLRHGGRHCYDPAYHRERYIRRRLAYRWNALRWRLRRK